MSSSILSAAEAARLLASLLGGGLVVGIMNVVRSRRRERVTRRIAALQAQIERLYGPLYFFVAQNRILLQLSEAFQSAYKSEFIDKRWSEAEPTQKRISEELDQTIDLSNAYANLLLDNNECILRIMRDGFAYIDMDDVAMFGEFIVDYTRRKTEIDGKGRLKTPRSIYAYIGDIFLMRPAFVERVETKVMSKRKELASYQGRADA